MDATIVVLVLGGLVLVVGVRVALGRRRARLRAAQLASLDERDLALRLEAVYWRLGYRVQRAPSGAELVVANAGARTAVRVSRRLDAEAVRAAAAAKAELRCEQALLVAPVDAERGARRAAEAAGVGLVARADLVRLLASAGG
jgi:HJR/Mrr/RecB family endonuclease